MDDLQKKSYRRATKIMVFGLLAFITCLSILYSPFSPYTEGSPGNSQSALYAHSWYLTSYHTETGVIPVIEKTEVILAFNGNGNISGSSGCNLYLGDCTLSGDTLQVRWIESTQMISEPEVLEQEKAFFSLLQEAKTYTVVGDCLLLFDASGILILSFTCQTPSLQGEEWYLGYSLSDTGGIVQEYGSDQISLQFPDENTLRGAVMGTEYCGTYEANEDFIHFTSAEVFPKNQTSTDERAELSDWYFSLLKQAHSYMISGSQLDIFNENGHSILSFTRMPLPLVLNDWYLQKYPAENGSSLISSTGAYDLITFMPDGKVVGTFREILFSTAYDADKDNSSISFGPVAMLIPEDDDPGKSDKYMRDLELIFEEARSYRVRNGSLELFSGEGETLLIMANIPPITSLS